MPENTTEYAKAASQPRQKFWKDLSFKQILGLAALHAYPKWRDTDQEKRDAGNDWLLSLGTKARSLERTVINGQLTTATAFYPVNLTPKEVLVHPIANVVIGLVYCVPFILNAVSFALRKFNETHPKANYFFGIPKLLELSFRLAASAADLLFHPKDTSKRWFSKLFTSHDEKKPLISAAATPPSTPGSTANIASTVVANAVDQPTVVPSPQPGRPPETPSGLGTNTTPITPSHEERKGMSHS